MTLCIAAICRQENKIVTVTDFLLSDGETSFESKFLKVQTVGNTGKWMQLYAGDPSRCMSMLLRIREKLSGLPQETFEELKNVYRESMRAERRQKIEDTILSKYGLTLDEFIANGLQYFGSTEFPRLLNAISEVDLESEFLIAGFDEGLAPHLFAISDSGGEEDGECQIYDIESFHAIGEGSRLADASLIYNFDPFKPIEDIVYRLCEAKVRSHEAVASVGKPTYLTILESNGVMTQIRPEQVDGLTKTLKKRLYPPIPVGSKNLISAFIAAAKEEQ